MPRARSRQRRRRSGCPGPAPAAVDILADVSVEKGAAAVSVAAAQAFAGEGLTFAATGAGVRIDPATGVLTLPTDVAREGETVTVTASNSGGSAETSFLVTVTVPVVLVAPVVITAPALKGTARIGSELTVATGLWSGLPLPVLALQWLRDGAGIAGATAAVYVPVAADDRCALSCRVTGTNSVGRAAVETASLTATHAAPTVVGELLDEIFDQDGGSETIATAQVFAGHGLRFGATGAGVAIDPATGVLTVSTAAPLSGEVVVSATNSGGSAEARFLLTVEAAGPVTPGYIRAELVEFKGIPLAEGGVVYSASLGGYIQRARLVLKAGIAIPATHELLLLRGLSALPDLSWLAKIQSLPGLKSYNGSAAATWDSANGGRDGATQYLFLYWREVASGTLTEALEVPAKFNSVAAAPNSAGDGNTKANQALSAANQTALKAALDARIASKSTDTWIIDCPSGNYGLLDLSGRQMPGTTVLRSASGIGAKFSGINMTGCKNIAIQLVDVDRSLGGASSYGVVMNGAKDCSFAYSRVYVGPITPAATGWAYNVNFAIEVNGNGSVLPERCRIHIESDLRPVRQGNLR